MVRGWMRAIALLAVVAAAGCGGKERVTLSASVRNVELRVEQRTLGTFLAGRFELRLELGPNAPESTTASLEDFRLVRASDQSELVSTLPLTDAPDFIELDPGDAQTVPLVLDDSAPISQDSQAEICAEPVQILGSVTDTLSEQRTTPLSSAQFAPEGC